MLESDPGAEVSTELRGHPDAVAHAVADARTDANAHATPADCPSDPDSDHPSNAHPDADAAPTDDSPADPATAPVTVEIHPVTEERFADLADLFESHGATRGCWCMAFIAERKVFHDGWHEGKNRERFEEMAKTADPPMGLIGYDEDGTPIAWCAMGPRSRYPRTIGPRATILAGRDKSEDDDVWLMTCFFTRVGYRSKGTTRKLLDAAVAYARKHGAKAVEGIPIATGWKKSDEYVGREQVFEAAGFTCTARPTPRRAVMRRELS
jgi:GNAT superfamily N-acetyltransferase